VPTALAGYDTVVAVLRVAFFAFAAVAVVVVAIDWAVRTRRINPFSPVARFFRQTIDPMMLPVERRIVRSGGSPSTAPWWALVVVVVAGIVVLSLLEFVRGQIGFVTAAVGSGSRGIYVLLVRWVFAILQAALIVRVISSWISISPYSRWVRWAFTLSEPILRPLRRFIPTLGMIDITPIIAFFLLRLIEGLLLGLRF
jgi:YggT family protein